MILILDLKLKLERHLHLELILKELTAYLSYLHLRILSDIYLAVGWGSKQ